MFFERKVDRQEASVTRKPRAEVGSADTRDEAWGRQLLLGGQRMATAGTTAPAPFPLKPLTFSHSESASSFFCWFSQSLVSLVALFITCL